MVSGGGLVAAWAVGVSVSAGGVVEVDVIVEEGDLTGGGVLKLGWLSVPQARPVRNRINIK